VFPAQGEDEETGTFSFSKGRLGPERPDEPDPRHALRNNGLQDLTLVLLLRKEYMMAKYGKSAQRSVKRAMHKLKEGTLKSGKSGNRVKSRKQAIAIGLSEARRKGAKVPAE
jgi:hypothetical protein